MGRRSLARKLSTRLLVNNLTPFLFSTHYLSEEIDSKNLSFLNTKSKPLAAEDDLDLGPRAVVYCSLFQLEQFATDYLPRIRSDFVLISGSIHLPPGLSGETIKAIASFSSVSAWFSQATEFLGDVPRPFPLGLAHQSADRVLGKMLRLRIRRKKSLYTPYCSIHEHLPPFARFCRESISNSMDFKRDLSDYLDLLSKHRFVMSPPGDRWDCHRHWEAIAMGALPVIPGFPGVTGLLSDSALIVQEFPSFEKVENRLMRERPLRRLVFNWYWRKKVFEAIIHRENESRHDGLRRSDLMPDPTERLDKFVDTSVSRGRIH